MAAAAASVATTAFYFGLQHNRSNVHHTRLLCRDRERAIRGEKYRLGSSRTIKPQLVSLPPRLFPYRDADGVVQAVVDDGEEEDGGHGQHGQNGEGDEGHV